jgi:ribonuclease BN (tRNA processing enzyme)
MPDPRANTSVSLFVEQGGQPVWHGLVDVGSGVVNSLVHTYPYPRDQIRLDDILLTHWHADHTSGLTQLMEGYKRSRERFGVDHRKPTVHCRRGTLERLPSDIRSRCQHVVPTEENEPQGRRLDTRRALGGALTITPISISHTSADTAGYSTAGYVVELERRVKVAMLWDLGADNDWLAAPTTESRAAFETVAGANLVFYDCNTWAAEAHGERPAPHGSFQRIMGYATSIEAHETGLIHISGHEDLPGNPGWGWTAADWQNAAREAWGSRPGVVSAMSIGEARTF